MRSQAGSFTHSPNEPVTLLNCADMLIWCNALSEINGRTPVYYADEAKTKPLKRSTCYRWAIGERDGEKRNTQVDETVYVKWSADGWRLPTEPERTCTYLNYALSYHPAGLLINGGGSGYPGAIDLRIAKGRGAAGGVGGDTFQLTAACDDKHVYVGSEDGHLYAIDVRTGTEKWQFATGGKITHSSPWVGSGVVYIGSSDGYLYALH